MLLNGVYIQESSVEEYYQVVIMQHITPLKELTPQFDHLMISFHISIKILKFCFCFLVCFSGHLPQFGIKEDNGPKMDVYILSASQVVILFL